MLRLILLLAPLSMMAATAPPLYIGSAGFSTEFGTDDTALLGSEKVTNTLVVSNNISASRIFTSNGVSTTGLITASGGVSVTGNLTASNNISAQYLTATRGISTTGNMEASGYISAPIAYINGSSAVSISGGDGRYVNASGDTMTGVLNMSATDISLNLSSRILGYDGNTYRQFGSQGSISDNTYGFFAGDIDSNITGHYLYFDYSGNAFNIIIPTSNFTGQLNVANNNPDTQAINVSMDYESGNTEMRGVNVNVTSNSGTVYGVYSAVNNVDVISTAYGGFFVAGSADSESYGTYSQGANYGAYGNGGGYGVFGVGGAIGTYGSGPTGVRGDGTTYGVYAQGGTYGLYSSSGLNYFSDNVGIGVLSPTAKLEVSGIVSSSKLWTSEGISSGGKILGSNGISVTGNLTTTGNISGSNLFASNNVTSTKLYSSYYVSSPSIYGLNYLGSGSVSAPSGQFSSLTVTNALTLSNTISAPNMYASNSISGQFITGSVYISSPSIFGLNYIGSGSVSSPSAQFSTLTASSSVTSPNLYISNNVTSSYLNASRYISSPSVYGLNYIGSGSVSSPTAQFSTLTASSSVTSPNIYSSNNVTGSYLNASMYVSSPAIYALNYIGSGSVSSPSAQFSSLTISSSVSTPTINVLNLTSSGTISSPVAQFSSLTASSSVTSPLITTGNLTGSNTVSAPTGWFSNLTSTLDTTISRNLTVDTNTLFASGVLHNVGIGTTNPGRKLEISDTDSNTGLRITGTNSGRSYLLTTGIASGDGKFAIYDYGSSLTRLAIDTNGNVGIGLTAPTAKLAVSGTISSSGLVLGKTAVFGGMNSNNSSGVLQIGRADGDVGTMTTTLSKADEYLHIGGREDAGYHSIGFGWAGATYSPGYIAFRTTTTSGNEYGDLIFGTRSVVTDTQPSERMRIDSTGNVGIGTPTPGATLSVSGNVSVTGNLTASGTISAPVFTGPAWHLDVPYVAGSTSVSATKVVYKNAVANQVELADSTQITRTLVLGFALSDAVSGSPVNVREKGIVGGFSSITPGSRYYLSTSGNVTTTVSSAISSSIIQVGVGKSATEIDVNIIDMGVNR
jgi:fibronectin-binding autotransporter adhesin